MNELEALCVAACHCRLSHDGLRLTLWWSLGCLLLPPALSRYPVRLVLGEQRVVRAEMDEGAQPKEM